MIKSIQCSVATVRVLVVAAAASAFAGLVPPAPAAAHELRPAIAAADIESSGEIELRVALNLEAQLAGIGPEHANTSDSDNASTYDRLREASPEALRVEFTPVAADLIDRLHLVFDGTEQDLTLSSVEIPATGDLSISRVSTLVLTGTAPADSTTMTWTADTAFGDNVIRVTRAGEEKPFFSAFLQAGQPSPEIPLDGIVEERTWSNFLSYVAIGFDHIVPKGLDHILFMIGLFLLSPSLRILCWQVTAFTLAHSVTLALGIYGIVSVPAAIVEPLIAASIVFVAVENLFTDRLWRWRPFVIFGFGLLHGLGFADVLSEVGLPPAHFVSALVGFNVGVELGQLAVIATCFLCVGLWFRHRRWYRHAITMPASIAVACVAVFWVIERTV